MTEAPSAGLKPILSAPCSTAAHVLGWPGICESPNQSCMPTPLMPCRAQIIEDAAVHEQYSRVITPEPAMSEETEDVCALLQQCLDLRCVFLGCSQSPLSTLHYLVSIFPKASSSSAWTCGVATLVRLFCMLHDPEILQAAMHLLASSPGDAVTWGTPLTLGTSIWSVAKMRCRRCSA